MGLINKPAVDRAILNIVKEEMNTTLDRAVEKTIDPMRKEIRSRVANKMIALIAGDYDMRLATDRLVISVKLD